VPPWSPAIVLAEEQKVPIIGELELAWHFCKGPVAAVTGSNGKSTTVTLISDMLQKAGIGCRLCGNIGIPLIEETTQAHEGDVLVTEVSSFQLERTVSFKPRISALLNISPNHLDRYPSMVEYRAAKLRILDNQDESCFAVVNRDLDAEVNRYIGNRRGPRLIFFGRDDDCDIAIGEDDISFRVMGCETGEIKRSDIRHLKGEHNRWNIAAAGGVALLLGTHFDALRETLAEFKGLEHRLEFVDEIDGVRYVNDSKATTVDAALIAIDTVGNGVILIAGGRDKGSDFSPLCEAVSGKVKAAVLIGETTSVLSNLLRGCTRVETGVDMRDAVRKARAIAQRGDTVLLSPACASYDMFRNFEERGSAFKAEIQRTKYEDSPTKTQEERTR
jgi:UDP-N-acetylmuramoylalanine--D-glutamate ligase